MHLFHNPALITAGEKPHRKTRREAVKKLKKVVSVHSIISLVSLLVGGWTNPSEKICSSNWVVHLPQISGWKINQIFGFPSPRTYKWTNLGQRRIWKTQGTISLGAAEKWQSPTGTTVIGESFRVVFSVFLVKQRLKLTTLKMEKNWSNTCFCNLVLKMRNVRSRKNNQLTLNNTKHMCGAVFV